MSIPITDEMAQRSKKSNSEWPSCGGDHNYVQFNPLLTANAAPRLYCTKCGKIVDVMP